MLVGHLTRDILASGTRGGGTVLYAGVAAARLGRRVAIATVCGDDAALPPELSNLTLCRRRAPQTTTFAIKASVEGRSLQLLARAPRLRARDVPAAWRAESHSRTGGPDAPSPSPLPPGGRGKGEEGFCPIVHLAPVADEVPRSAARWFGGPVVATAQGWLRSYDPEGLVSPAADGLSKLPAGGLSALVFSVEDIASAEGAMMDVDLGVPVVAVTRGAQGCTVYAQGRAVDVPACPAREVDPTGAGDVFAAAFFVRLAETDDPVASAYFASCAAALSVEGAGVSRIPVRPQVEARLAEWSRA